MNAFKIYVPCLLAAGLSVSGNFIQGSVPTAERMPPSVSQAVGDDDDGGFFIFDTKWVRPPKTDPVDRLSTAEHVLATYGQ